MSGAATAGNLGARNLASLWRWGAKGALVLAFLVAGGAFSLQLSGLDPGAPVGAESASFRSKLSLALAFLVVALSGAVAWRRIGLLLSTNALLFALPVLAMLSAVWAPEPSVALRRAAAFMATVLSGFAIVAHLPGARALRFVTHAAFAAMLLSILYVVVRPDYGLHQLTDGAQSVHAGDWRGVFIHRTALGRLAALSLALAIYSDAVTRPLVRAGMILASLSCLVMAHSAGGFGSAAILLATPPALSIVRTVARRNRPVAIGLVVSAVMLAAALAPMLAPLILQALGKDPSLTGRADFWGLMLRAAEQRPILGYGYSTGFRTVVAKLVEVNSPYGYVPNAQNGYLDVVLNLGLLGLTLTVAVLALAFRRALRLAFSPPGSRGDDIVPLLIWVFIVEMNLVEAALISANDIFVLIYATAAVASGEMLQDRRQSRPGRPTPPRALRAAA